MFRYLWLWTEPFSDRYRQYLPLPTSTPRGSVSAQGSGSSSPLDAPSSSVSNSSPLRGLHKKAALRRRSLSWHLKFLLILIALAYTLHTAVQHFFFPPPASSEVATAAALSLLSQQLSNSAYPQTLFTHSPDAPLETAESLHRLFQDRAPGIASRDVLPIRAYDALSDACVEEWVVHHRWGDACKGTDLSEGLKFDAVWAWVNGSDPAQIIARHTFRPSSPINVDAAHRYADHNELLYSMRSMWQSFGKDAIGKMHVMASAYPLPAQTVAELSKRGRDSNGGEKTIWAGQVPYWLNATLDNNAATIDLHHDAEYFAPMQVSSPERQLSSSDVDAWRAKTLPSFNSLAVESQLYNLPRASSDQLVYLNDDFFTMVPNSVSDLTSPLFGTVIKSDTHLFSFYRPSEHPFQRLWNPAGEEVGIKRAAWILGQRFPMRTLPYITHHPRSLSLPLLKEAAQTFPEAFSNTALARFRAQKEVPDSIQAFFLASWYIVERHREALLWSWVVAKWGGIEGKLGKETKRAMWNELSSTADFQAADDKIDVRRPKRRSRDEDKESFDKAHVPAPKNTEYSFSSQDGHALSYLEWSWPWARSRSGYPDLSAADHDRKHARSWFSSEQDAPKVCRLSFSKCFAPQQEDESADSLFKRIGFANSACGDCILAALLNASGRSGISAFLPPPSATVRVNENFETLGSRAHLPLTERWRETDFTLPSILSTPHHATQHAGKEISLRTWCTRLIQRYQYVLGSTPSTFYKVEYASRLPKQLEAVDKTLNTTEPTTFVCLNDDMKESNEGTRKLNGIMQDWFSNHWSQKLPGEL
ncbi:uncharacterized protein UTRI_01587 [Ustilago trichophora]|uniref:Stealth protein CR3 conserved region 3 domain-containing protein n=1 Tax=Ustilago trichophora TaxID=86804 RepID=A0A5C3E0J8_9BASI|nr:uncharacterized protein UTRI_01587 [Ustilago trichophora]